MCNRYRASSITRIRDIFGFTDIESRPPMEERYKTTGTCPLQPGPFIRKRDVMQITAPAAWMAHHGGHAS
jgi:hypothetical protein